MWILIFKEHIGLRRVIFSFATDQKKKKKKKKKRGKQSGEIQHIYLSTARQDKEVLTTV